MDAARRDNAGKAHGSKGQSLVELAVSLTFLLILVGGVIDLGRAFFTFITLRDAAQEGAAYASYKCEKESSGTSCIKGSVLDGQIRQRVRESSQGGIVNLSTWPNAQIDVEYFNGDVAISGAAACAGDAVRVTVREPKFTITMPFIGAFIGQEFPIQASVTDTVLAPMCP